MHLVPKHHQGQDGPRRVCLVSATDQVMEILDLLPGQSTPLVEKQQLPSGELDRPDLLSTTAKEELLQARSKRATVP